MSGKYDPQRYGVPSSGDAEEDQRQIQQHIRATMRIDEGLCPNHAESPAQLVEIGPNTWQCPQCKFIQQRFAFAV